MPDANVLIRANARTTPVQNQERMTEWRDWSARVIVVSAVAIPLFIVLGAADGFRLPKDVLFRAEAVLLAALYVVARIWDRRPDVRLDWKDHTIWIPMVILGWTTIATITSTNRMHSYVALITIASAIVIYVVTRAVVGASGLSLLWAIVIPATVNAALAILQETINWSPFVVSKELPHHLRTTALLGNPNDIGCYLAPGVVTALAAAIVSTGALRKGFVAACALITAGLIISQTVTAIIATVIACVVLVAVLNLKRAIIVTVALLVLLAASVVAYRPFRTRASHVRAWIAARNYNAMTTDRLTAFSAALIMSKDHPVFGVGPGCFSWNYFDYKIRAEQAHPSLRTSFNRGTNFGEVHNDYLQVAAETGIVGLLAFLSVLACLAAVTLQKPAVQVRRALPQTARFARLSALPLATVLALLALAQFPLELTSVVSVFTFLAAVVVSWSPIA